MHSRLHYGTLPESVSPELEIAPDRVEPNAISRSARQAGQEHEVSRKNYRSDPTSTSTPNGIRTRVPAVKGQCPRPLNDGGRTSIESTSAAFACLLVCWRLRQSGGQRIDHHPRHGSQQVVDGEGVSVRSLGVEVVFLADIESSAENETEVIGYR